MVSARGDLEEPVGIASGEPDEGLEYLGVPLAQPDYITVASITHESSPRDLSPDTWTSGLGNGKGTDERGGPRPRLTILNSSARVIDVILGGWRR